ncbi:MAG: LPS assembly lipoprotein LptE [Bdellovibrionia bacterium]
MQKVYVAPVANHTYKAGIENTVYNSLLRTLKAHGRVTLVHHPVEADAILGGSVVGAAYGASAATAVSQLNPNKLGATLPTANFSVATEYTASLSCIFNLTRRVGQPGKPAVIWASSFGRSQPFPASNQLDVPGTTSALINDSEFDRALSDLAKSMMDDVHESMLAMF